MIKNMGRHHNETKQTDQATNQNPHQTNQILINPCSFTQLFCPEHVMPYLNSHLKISEYDWKIIKI